MAMSGASVRLGKRLRTRSGSQDTLRRWDRARKPYHRDEGNRRVVPPEEVRRLTTRRQRHATGAQLSACNRLNGIVRDGVMALVEIEAGSYLITAAVTRDSVDELGLVEGIEATATVKATSVMIERDIP